MTVKIFFAYLLQFFGGVTMLLSGGCATIFIVNARAHDGQLVLLALGVAFLPFIIGIGIFKLGRYLAKSDKSDKEAQNAKSLPDD